MVCVEELCSIFKNLHPHKRIELMCGLLQCCLPLELRFIGSYVENLGRRDFHYLREYELKANSCPEINKLFKASEDVIRRKLAVYLSLLHTSNTLCSKLCFDLLSLLNTYLIRAYASHEKPNQDVMMELLTVLVMGINHPAFTFEQRRRLYDIYRWLEMEFQWRVERLNEAVSAAQLLAKGNAPANTEQGFGCMSSSESVLISPDDHGALDGHTVDALVAPAEPFYVPSVVGPQVIPSDTLIDIGDPSLEPQVTNCPHSPQDPQLLSPRQLLQVIHSPKEAILSPGMRSPVASLEEQYWPCVEVGQSPSQSEILLQQDVTDKVFIKRVEVKGSRKMDRKQEFRMEVTWSNGEISEVFKSYQEVYDFHTRLVQCYPEDASGHRQDRKLPFLCGNPHLSAKDDGIDQTSATITNYFRKLVSLQNDILGCDHVIQFFRESPPLLQNLTPSPRRSSHVEAPRITSPVFLSSGETKVTDSRSPPGFIVSSRPSPPREPLAPLILSSPPNSPQRPSGRSRSTSPADRLPTVQQLLEDLQLSHHGNSFSKYTTKQLLNFDEDDFKKLKLSSHAQKRLKTKLGQLRRNHRLMNGLREEVRLSLSPAQPTPDVSYSSSPSSASLATSPSRHSLPPDTLYTSTASLGQLTGSDTSSRDSSPPVSPRQTKTIKKSKLSKIPDLGEGEAKDESAVNQTPQDGGESSPVSGQDSHNYADQGHLTSSQGHPGVGCHPKLGQNYLESDHSQRLDMNHYPGLVQGQSSPCNQGPILVISANHDPDNLNAVVEAKNLESSDQRNQDFIEAGFARLDLSPQRGRSPGAVRNETKLQSQDDFLPKSDGETGPLLTVGANTATADGGRVDHEFMALDGNAGLENSAMPLTPNPKVFPSDNTVTPADSGTMVDSSNPIPDVNAVHLDPKTVDQPAPQIFAAGFVSDHPHAFHHHRPSYPRMLPHMYPICPPQPAHLPLHMYHKMALSPDQIQHCKLPSGHTIQSFIQRPARTETPPNSVMTVTVNSTAYSTSMTECPGHVPHQPGAGPVVSGPSSARTITLQNPVGPSARFSIPSTIPSPISYQNVTPAVHPQVHRKVLNGQTSNNDSGMSSPATSVESVGHASTQHINTSVAAPHPYTPSGVHGPMISVHSSACTSCGCRGRCGVPSTNYSAAYGGYVHTQVSMPPVVHIPTFLPPNSNGLLPSPCLPPLPFHNNPVPNLHNGISPEHFTIHSYLSQAASQHGQGPAPWNSMLYGYGSQTNQAAAGKPRHLTCYNCGEAGHEAHDCKDSNMESASGQYSLNFKPDFPE